MSDVRHSYCSKRVASIHDGKRLDRRADLFPDDKSYPPFFVRSSALSAGRSPTWVKVVTRRLEFLSREGDAVGQRFSAPIR